MALPIAIWPTRRDPLPVGLGGADDPALVWAVKHLRAAILLG